jgi:hypothetical protein
MSTELTWASDVNRQVASAADAATQNKWELWYLCASLVGNTGLGFASNSGNWSVVRTCGSTDGTAGNLTADTTDRLHLTGSGAFTANDWVFGANTTGGTGRSWALLQSPAAIGSYYMLVDFGNATGGKCDLTFGKTLSGNGTTTTAPTFSDGWSYAGAQFSDNTITKTHRVSLQLSTRGDFWWFEVYDTLTTAYAVLAVTKLANTHSIDTYTTVSLFGGAAATGTTFAAGVNTTNLNGNGCVTIKGRSFNGAGAPTLLAPAPCFGSGALSSAITGGSYASANFSDNTYNALPIYVLDGTNSDLRGRVPDLLWASGGATSGSNIGVTTPFDYVKLGHCWMPWVSTSAIMI